MNQISILNLNDYIELMNDSYIIDKNLQIFDSYLLEKLNYYMKNIFLLFYFFLSIYCAILGLYSIPENKIKFSYFNFTLSALSGILIWTFFEYHIIKFFSKGYFCDNLTFRKFHFYFYGFHYFSPNNQ